MNPLATRVLKEARPLFWPWFVVTAAGLLPLFGPYPQSVLFAISRLGLLFGMPLLAVLSFGREFDHGTFSLLLSQPVERTRIWGEKLSITAVAVLSSALAFAWAGAYYPYGIQPNVVQWAPLALSVGIFCTLVARSSMGGYVLSISLLVGAFFAWSILIYPFVLGIEFYYYRVLPQPKEDVVAILCFCGLMLWLGYREMARFQATGGVASGDVIVSGPAVMPSAIAGLFRCRPSGATLNMIRKELRLLRPLWLIAGVFIAGWTGMAIMIWFRPQEWGHFLEDILSVTSVTVYLPLVAVLAGSLSLGEERASGIQSWHLTLPVSARRQWFIKLATALFVGFTCGVLIPALAVFALRFTPVVPFSGALGTDWPGPWPILAALFTFASFWCACARKGTLTAMFWVLPFLCGLLLATGGGAWIANYLDPIRLLHLKPIRSSPVEVLSWPWFPTLFLAVIQSYRMFRNPPTDSALSVIRSLLPLAGVAFLCSFVLEAFAFHGIR